MPPHNQKPHTLPSLYGTISPKQIEHSAAVSITCINIRIPTNRRSTSKPPPWHTLLERTLTMDRPPSMATAAALQPAEDRSSIHHNRSVSPTISVKSIGATCRHQTVAMPTTPPPTSPPPLHLTAQQCRTIVHPYQRLCHNYRQQKSPTTR